MQMNHAGDGRRHANWTDRGASGADLHTEEGRRRSGVAKPERWPVPIGWEKNESRITLKVANQEPPAKGLTGLTSQLRAAHCMFSIQSGAIGEVWGAGPSASKLGGAIFFFVIGINSLAASDWLVMSRGAVPIALKSGMHPGPIFDVLFFCLQTRKRERERERGKLTTGMNRGMAPRAKGGLLFLSRNSASAPANEIVRNERRARPDKWLACARRSTSRAHRPISGGRIGAANRGPAFPLPSFTEFSFFFWILPVFFQFSWVFVNGTRC